MPVSQEATQETPQQIRQAWEEVPSEPKVNDSTETPPDLSASNSLASSGAPRELQEEEYEDQLQPDSSRFDTNKSNRDFIKEVAQTEEPETHEEPEKEGEVLEINIGERTKPEEITPDETSPEKSESREDESERRIPITTESQVETLTEAKNVSIEAPDNVPINNVAGSDFDYGTSVEPEEDSQPANKPQGKMEEKLIEAGEDEPEDVVKVDNPPLANKEGEENKEPNEILTVIDALGNKIMVAWSDFQENPQEKRPLNEIQEESLDGKYSNSLEIAAKEYETVLKSIFMRTLISEEQEKFGDGSGQEVSILKSKDEEISGENGSDQDLNKKAKDKLAGLFEVPKEKREALRNFIVEVSESLRFELFDEKNEQENEYNLEADKLRQVSRYELGYILLKMAEEKIKDSGSVPGKEQLLSTYEEKLGSMLNALGLFDISLVARQNKIISEMARERGKDKVVLLSEAFGELLETKRKNAESKIREYLVKKMEESGTK